MTTTASALADLLGISPGDVATLVADPGAVEDEEAVEVLVLLDADGVRRQGGLAA